MKRHDRLAAMLLALALTARLSHAAGSEAVRPVAVSISAVTAAPNLLPASISRAALVSNIDKQNLPVSMALTEARLRDLDSRYPNSPRVQDVKAAFSDVRAVRSMEVVDGRIRGDATRVRITIVEKRPEGLRVEAYAKGDPRTAKGGNNIIKNVQRAVQLFRDMALSRAEDETFPGHRR